jgi:acyl carrier protein
LVVLQELRATTDVDADALMRTVRQAVAEDHGLSVHVVALLHPRTIIKTSSGKIQRFACRQAFLDGTLSVVDQSTLEIGEAVATGQTSMLPDLIMSVAADQRPKLLRSYLRRRLADVLGLKALDLGPDQPLGVLGLTSVQAVELSARLEQDAGVELPATLIYDYPTLRSLAELVLERVQPSADDASSDRRAETAAADAVLAEVAAMSDEDAEKALMRELSELK